MSHYSDFLRITLIEVDMLLDGEVNFSQSGAYTFVSKGTLQHNYEDKGNWQLVSTNNQNANEISSIKGKVIEYTLISASSQTKHDDDRFSSKVRQFLKQVLVVNLAMETEPSDCVNLTAKKPRVPWDKDKKVLVGGTLVFNGPGDMGSMAEEFKQRAEGNPDYIVNGALDYFKGRWPDLRLVWHKRKQWHEAVLALEEEKEEKKRLEEEKTRAVLALEEKERAVLALEEEKTGLTLLVANLAARTALTDAEQEYVNSLLKGAV